MTSRSVADDGSLAAAPGRVPVVRLAEAGLEALRCRDDILQAMFWLRGEGFGSDTDAVGLARLISVDAGLVREQLVALEHQGSVDRTGDRYRLSATGLLEGGRRFSDEFSDLQLTAHGECAPDCPHCEGVERGEGCTHCVTTLDAQVWAR